jgi:hypothetical protein
MACSFAASAQSFGFASTGGGLYCNFEQLSISGGFVGGYDNLSACGSGVNSTISGFNATVPNDGPSVHGPGVVYGDSIYATLSGDPYAQWTVFSKLKANKVNKEGQYTGTYSWIGAASFSGVFVGTNEGYLSSSVPGKNGNYASKGATTVNKK